MTTALIAFGVVFVAELGDKSQLLALSFATRRPPVVVLFGVTLAAASLMAASVLAGGAISDVVPAGVLDVIAGVAFLGFAVWTWWGSSGDRGDAASERTKAGVLVIAGAIAIGELGDKTMLAAFALATSRGVLGTWAGATAGMVVADGLAVLVGHQVGNRLPDRAVRGVAAVLFAACGVVILVSRVTG